MAKPLPEYNGETIESHYRNRAASTGRQVSEKRRLFLFENQEATGQPFSKKNSLNMKNFSSVRLGDTDDIKDTYEKEAKRKLYSPVKKV